MRILQQLGSFLIAFALVSLAGMLLRASPVMAQQSWNDLTIARPAADVAPVRLRKAIADDDSAPLTGAAVASSADEPRGAALRRGQLDGAAEGAFRTDVAVDGRIEPVEPLGEADGREAVVDDPRLPADRAAFLAPPAGYDALAFQIELDPANDARPGRLARFEPYAPVGRRAGSWVVFPTVEVGVTGTTNVYRTSPAKPDVILDVRPTLLAVTNWERHALQVRTTGLGSAYGTHSTENDRSYGFEVRGRLDVTRQANIEVLASHSLDQEMRSSTLAPTDASKRTPYATDKVAFAMNQRFNRLSLQLRGAATETDYQPVPTIGGGTLSNAERDLSQRDIALRAAWSFSPALGVFAESALNTQAYRAVPVDGISRDSTGDKTRVGFTFGNTGQVWRGEIAVGYGHQHARDGRLQNVEGVLVDANLGWRPTALTSILLNARSDFLTSTTVGQGNATQRTVGVEVRHAFLRQLNGVAGVSLQAVDYQGLPLRELTTTAELGAEYFVTQSTALLARYSHVVLASTTAGAGTTTDAVRVGVRWRP